MNRSFQEMLQNRLKEVSPRRLRQPHTAQAAVLIAILERNNHPHFLLMRRSQQVATHKGQISFPGGLREASDVSLRNTAVRETSEELGIESRHIQVVGRFHDYLAVTDFLVRPFVGFLPRESKFSPQPREVEYLLEVPLAFFRDTQPEIRIYNFRGRNQNVYYYHFQNDTIWGLTARIIRDFLQILD